MNNEGKKSVGDLISSVKMVYGEKGEAIELGRRASWEVVGEVYAVGCEIDANPDDRHKLDLLVEELEEMKKHPGWVASTKTVFENVLVAALGYEKTLSKRHYYNSACENAKKANIEADKEKFADWAQGKGGIMAAAKGLAGQPAETAPDVIRRFAAKQSEKVEENGGSVIDVSFSPSPKSSYGVFLVEHLPDGKTRVIGTSTREAVVATVIKDIEAEPSPHKLQKIEGVALWYLNRLTQKLANAWRGKVEPDDFDRFEEAVEALRSHPSLLEKYFDGAPQFEVFDHKSRLRDQNTDAHQLDPARYIKNAKVGVMPPINLAELDYDPKADKSAKRAVLKNAPGYRDWIRQPPKRPRSDTAKGKA